MELIFFDRLENRNAGKLYMLNIFFFFFYARADLGHVPSKETFHMIQRIEERKYDDREIHVTMNKSRTECNYLSNKPK